MPSKRLPLSQEALLRDIALEHFGPEGLLQLVVELWSGFEFSQSRGRELTVNHCHEPLKLIPDSPRDRVRQSSEQPNGAKASGGPSMTLILAPNDPDRFLTKFFTNVFCQSLFESILLTRPASSYLYRCKASSFTVS